MSDTYGGGCYMCFFILTNVWIIVLLKVKTGENSYIHLRIYRPLPPNSDQLELHSLQENKAESDQLTYF